MKFYNSDKYTPEEQEMIFNLIISLNNGDIHQKEPNAYVSHAEYIVNIAFDEFDLFKNILNDKNN